MMPANLAIWVNLPKPLTLFQEQYCFYCDERMNVVILFVKVLFRSCNIFLMSIMPRNNDA